MEQNVQNVRSYKKTPIIEVPEIPQYFKLLPSTLSSSLLSSPTDLQEWLATTLLLPLSPPFDVIMDGSLNQPRLTNYLPSNTFLYHIWQSGSSFSCITQSFVAVQESRDVQFWQFENLESVERTTCKKGRKHTILLASPFVGVITILMGLFQVGSPAGYVGIPGAVRACAMRLVHGFKVHSLLPLFFWTFYLYPLLSHSLQYIYKCLYCS